MPTVRRRLARLSRAITRMACLAVPILALAVIGLSSPKTVYGRRLHQPATCGIFPAPQIG